MMKKIMKIGTAANFKILKLAAVPIFLLLSPICLAQQFSYKQFFAEQEKTLLLIQQKNPVLYEFEKRNLELMKEIQKTKEDYRKGRLTKEDARIKLRPLIKEQIEINNNPDYRIERTLNDVLY